MSNSKPSVNKNVRGMKSLIKPSELKNQLPLSEQAATTVQSGRSEIEQILAGEDRRFLVIVGPCSIHDHLAALEYAKQLAELRGKYGDRLCIVMRVYFEKPRTTVGWKGLINDPQLDGSFDINKGLRLARELLLAINELGVPAAIEFLDPTVPQYLDDLVSWAAIGARTTESQTHRQMASGLSMPVGFKNSTDGNVQIAVDALEAARHPHEFLGMNGEGGCCIVSTRGNKQGHLLLRGGNGKPNYHPDLVKAATDLLEASGLSPVLMVDCSHANSGKKHDQQGTVLRSVIEQRVGGSTAIIGAMLESNLEPGNQAIPVDLSQLKYGVSVTDACIGWEETEELLACVYNALPDLVVA
ncbi:MAG: 3-deoxy-7-phosphoheptulonate synthase [Candidatus Paceibacterota bacterium]